MLVIRFLRVGKKNQPSFKIVVTDKRRPPRGGRFVEEVGFYNPLKKEKVLREERIKYWLSVGAKPSDTVYNLLVSEKIIEGKKIPVHKKAKTTTRPPHPPAEGGPLKEEKPIEKKPAEEKPPTEEKPAEETPKEEKPKEEAPKKEEIPKEKASKEETPKTE